jgi:hypothetical protein
MNPLGIPKWGKKKLPEEDVSRGRNVSFGVRGETVELNRDAEEYITVEVRVDSIPHGEYRMEYLPGVPLGIYLRRLRLKRVACYSAVYDLKSDNRGRLRMTYLPKPQSHILIGKATIGTATSMQRSSVDAQRSAALMGGGQRVVEIKVKK